MGRERIKGVHITADEAAEAALLGVAVGLTSHLDTITGSRTTAQNRLYALATYRAVREIIGQSHEVAFRGSMRGVEPWELRRRPRQAKKREKSKRKRRGIIIS